MNVQHIPSRPHVQGATQPIHLRPSSQELTDGAGLLVLRRLWDELDLGGWIDDRASEVGGWFTSSLMVEVWIALLWYGSGWLDDLKLMARRRVRRLFGWERVPDPTTVEGRKPLEEAEGTLALDTHEVNHLNAEGRLRPFYATYRADGRGAFTCLRNRGNFTRV